MEPIEVTARFDMEGKAFPQQFVWNGRVYAVTSTGRRWQDQAGEHVLVMTAEMKTYELVFAPDELRWYLNSIDVSPKIALTA